MDKPHAKLGLQWQTLRTIGWSEKTVEAFFGGDLSACSDELWLERFREAMTFASPIFISMWRQEMRQGLDQKGAERLLTLAMTCLDMPKELTGTVDEVRHLLRRMAAIAPHDLFWRDFSRTVQLAYPKASFASQEGDLSLKKRLHQCRYLISAQQAQWVRQNFRRPGMTDRDALAVYLSRQPRFFPILRWCLGWAPAYQVRTSARLHNKRALDDSGKSLMPDLILRYNIKILLGFHSEFILSSDGDFLNELELEKPSLSGVVNGASFNYGGAWPKAHLNLDVNPVKPYDPIFRQRLVKNEGRPFKNPDQKAYRSRGNLMFSDNNQPLIRHVKALQKDFIGRIAQHRRS